MPVNLRRDDYTGKIEIEVTTRFGKEWREVDHVYLSGGVHGLRRYVPVTSIDEGIHWTVDGDCFVVRRPEWG